MKEIERIPLEGVFNCTDRDPPDVNSCAAFEFDSMTDLDAARVALIYRNAAELDIHANPTTMVTDNGLKIKPKCGSYEDPEIWIQDASSNWYFITDSFTKYLRLAVVHLGIIGWQNTYTSTGLSPVTKQWMSFFCKERLTLDLHRLHISKIEEEPREKNNNHGDILR